MATAMSETKTVGPAAASGERGAALLTVMLFMVLVSILISSMLAVTSNEVLISGAHRDSVRALELAQGDVAEAMRRIEAGHLLRPQFVSSLTGRTVTVTRLSVGVGSAYLLIQTEGRVNQATRRLSALVVQQAIVSPSDILFVDRLEEGGSGHVYTGDVYSKTYVHYKRLPDQNEPSQFGLGLPPTVTYAGWGITKDSPNPVTQCFSNETCQSYQLFPPLATAPPYQAGPPTPEEANLWPATRRSTYLNSTLGQEILTWAKLSEDAVMACSTLVGVNPPIDPAVKMANEKFPTGELTFGWDKDDWNARLQPGTVPSQVSSAVSSCGLPYKYVQYEVDECTFLGGSYCPNPNPKRKRWFKVIIYNQWLRNYWRFTDTKGMIKRDGSACNSTTDQYCLGAIEANLQAYPQFGAIPPDVPIITPAEGSYDLKIVGNPGQNNINISQNLGCKLPEMAGHASCSGLTASNPKVVWLTGPPGTQFHMTANGHEGHGTLFVDGDLVLTGSMDYYGTIIVTGEFTISTNGNAQIRGAVISNGKYSKGGGSDIWTGLGSASPPVGQSLAISRAWWER